MVVVTTVLYVYASSAHCSTCTGIGIGGIRRSRSSRVIVVVLYFVLCVFVVVEKIKMCAKVPQYGSLQSNLTCQPMENKSFAWRRQESNLRLVACEATTLPLSYTPCA